ncbi:WD40-repeat-containing domain protein [Crucibulum laeve]|uniref:WD40-repeat-containing domain protein n=1 Tax=Crucibulum laeve TaxID=68775 RepID=A0A5C3MEE0_9AGAR|nr:WD40-repeat-containing domain protein [Crucibulum laeve]
MNESLINPFSISHPTAVQTSLFATALFAKFDPSGRYIAAGRANGSAEIWDLETRAPIRWLDGHVKALTSLDWSRNSRFILTSAKDWNVVIWDLASKSDPLQRHNTIRFDAPVASASFHPRNSQVILALLTTGDAYVVDLRKEHRSRTELYEVLEESEEEEPSRPGMTCARFDPSGKHIFVGTTAGSLLVFNTRTKTMIARHKISGAGTMKGLEFSKSGRRLVTNSSDRTLRQFVVPTYPHPSSIPPINAGVNMKMAVDGEEPEPGAIDEQEPGAIDEQEPGSIDEPQQHENQEPGYIEQELEPTHRFSDPISKTAWHAMSYSPDGEWLAGGAADPAGHKIYIWDISNDGQLASALDGGREPLSHLHWHHTKSCIASTTIHGNILIWHCPSPERWGAFAGGFEEVDENVEYEEKEDEFDIEDAAVIFARKMKAEEEEVDIDTGSEPVAKPIPGGTSADDEDIAWAEEEPDGDDKLGWAMHVVMDDGEGDDYL